MKKGFALFFVVTAVALSSCGHSKEYIEEKNTEKWREGYEEGFEEGYERGYSEAEYYLQPDIWEAEESAADYGYEHGYEIGYDDGYYDCLEEHGLLPEPDMTGPRPQLKRD